MKTLLVLSLCFMLALPVIALAQDPASQSNSGSSAAQSSPSPSSAGQMGQSAKSESLKGTISQDGKTLVSDDGKSWTISNPDAVKGHEGHHVELKGTADSTTSQIQVSSVKMLKGEKGSMKKDTPQQ